MQGNGIIRGILNALLTAAIVVGGLHLWPPSGTPEDGRKPKPPTPAPTDTMLVNMRAAFKEDGGTKEQAAKLASIFRVAGQDGGTLDTGNFRTTGEALGAVSTAARSLLPLPALQATREVVAKELDSVLGTKADTPLDKVKTKAAFTRIATLYDSLP